MTKPGVYRHHKGAYYTVIGTLHDSTNGASKSRTMVHYVSLTTGKQCTREEGEFNELVWVVGRNIGKPVKVTSYLKRDVQPRFAYFGETTPMSISAAFIAAEGGLRKHVDEDEAVALAKRAQGKKAHSRARRL